MRLDRIIGALSGLFSAASVILAVLAPSPSVKFWAIVSAVVFGLICGAVVVWELTTPLRRIPARNGKTDSSSLVVPARLVKTELQSILARVHRLMNVDPTLTEEHLLPSERWATYRERFAASDSYDRVVTAYQEIARVNDQWRWRREGASTKRIGVNRAGDGLKELEAAAKDALAALDSPRVV